MFYVYEFIASGTRVLIAKTPFEEDAKRILSRVSSGLIQHRACTIYAKNIYTDRRAS